MCWGRLSHRCLLVGRGWGGEWSLAVGDASRAACSNISLLKGGDIASGVGFVRCIRLMPLLCAQRYCVSSTLKAFD